MSTITIPATATPGQTITVDGAKFTPRTKFSLSTVDANGVEVGQTSNTNRPRPDGTFHVGINVPPLVGPSKVRAYQGSTLVAEAPILVAVAAPPPPPTNARYLSPTGSDSADGSITSPWKTINRWLGNVGTTPPAPGSVLYLRGGTYSAHPVCYIGRHDSGVNSNDLYGTVSQPISIAAYPGEVPVFAGGSSTLLSVCRARFVIFDGFEVRNRPGTQTGHITTGQWPSGGPWGPADDLTFRKLTMSLAAGEGDSGYHPIYITAGSHRVTVEDSTFTGPGNLKAGDGGFAVQAYEGYRDAPMDTVIQRNTFDGWNQGGVTIWGGSESPAPTGSILGNQFRHCTTNIRLGPHGPVTVRGNYGQNGSVGNVIDDNAAATTADTNTWGLA